MESRRVTTALSCVLLAACMIVTAILVSVNRKINYLPESSVGNIIAVLEADGITVSSDIIATKRMKGDVFVFNSDEYADTVARTLGGGKVADTFSTPDGEIILLDNGRLLEFGQDFRFRYSADGNKYDFPTEGTLVYPSTVETDEVGAICEASISFLDSGSREFARSEQISIVTSVDMIYESGGMYYAVCSRTIDGLPITGDTVTCAYSDGKIIGAQGVWCFLTKAESYSAQLCDHLNILFNARKDITHEEGEKVEIKSIAMCYSLYYYGEGEDFCLIPCWQITTDTAGKIVYNALDGALYTR